jgi:hypothetical protein
MFANESIQRNLTRRHFLQGGSVGLGAAALALLLERDAHGAPAPHGIAHFPAKAQRVIWLTQAGAPSQLELFDYKPGLNDRFNENLPDSVRRGQRLTGMTSGQSRLPVAPSKFRFRQHGRAGLRTKSASSARSTPRPSTTIRR